MVYKKEELEKMALSDLRVIGREVGVKSATALRKKDLINGIYMVSNGLKSPHKSRSGRPAIKRVSKIESSCKKDGEIIEAIFENKNEKKVKRIEQKIDKLLVHVKELLLEILT